MKTFAHDFTTPEGAILCLEDAYLEKNINKAIGCKDFSAEASFMLNKMNNSGENFSDHPALREQTAKALKLSFIRDLTESGFPELKNSARTFTKKEKISEELCIITETSVYPDNSTSSQRINVFKTKNGWRVLNSID